MKKNNSTISRFWFTILFLLTLIYPLTAGDDIEADIAQMGNDVLAKVQELVKADQAIAVSEIAIVGKDEEDMRRAYALSEYITEIMANSKKFKVIEKKQISKILNALEMALTGLVDTGTAEVVGKLVGAQYILLGSLNHIEQKYMLNFRLVETGTGLVKWASSYELAESSADSVADIYRPPSWRLHAALNLIWYGMTPDGTALFSLGMSFGFRYNISGRHWLGLQINPFFYHYSREQEEISGDTKTILYYGFRSAIEFLPGYSYRLPVSRALTINIGLYGGVITYKLREFHTETDTGNGSEEREESSVLKVAPLVLPQFDLAILDNQAFSFFIRLGYFVILQKTSVSAFELTRTDIPHGIRLEGGASFFF